MAETQAVIRAVLEAHDTNPSSPLPRRRNSSILGGYPTRSGSIIERHQPESPTQVDEIKVDIAEEAPRLSTRTPFAGGSPRPAPVFTPTSSSLKTKLDSENEIKIYRNDEERKTRLAPSQQDNRRSFVSTTSLTPSISSNGQNFNTPPEKPTKQKTTTPTSARPAERKVTIQQRTPVKNTPNSSGSVPVATVSFDLSMSKSFRSPASGKKSK